MDPLTLLHLDREPDAPLVVTSDEVFTRGRLQRRAAAVGRRLRELGVTEGNVIISLDSGPAFIAALAGSWLAGTVPVLLDPQVRQELLSAIEMTGAGAVLRSSPGSERLPRGVRELILDSREEDPYPAPSKPRDTPLVYLFTSGSSGRPTLVPKNFSHIDVEICFLSFLFEQPRRVATLVPWCHIFGFLASFMVPVRQIGVCDLTAGISPKLVLERAAAGRLDLVVAVPAVYQVMVRFLETGDINSIPTTCRFATSGAPLHSSVRKKFTDMTGCRLTDLYGSTEAGGVAFRHDDGPWIVEPHVETRVTDEGFLEVRSPSVSFGDPRELYRIGDLVREQGRGFVLVGREDDVVKIGGRRTALGEVNEVIESCSTVSHAIVLAEDVRGVKRLVAYVEPSSKDVDPESLKAFVRKRLADHKVPRIIRILEKLPRTASGKVDRQALISGTHGSSSK